ncbi:MAG TPA: MarR family transcriptional regulator [Labilithrix sp.]
MSTEYRALAEMRYRLRRFLAFSENAAREAGVEPQQHLLLLAIRGMPEDESPTIGRIAERLQIQHNSAVELVARSTEKGLVQKRPGSRDRREVRLAITTRGRRVLERLSVAHRAELRRAAPALADAFAVLATNEVLA